MPLMYSRSKKMDKDEEFSVKIVSQKKDSSNFSGSLYVLENEIKFSISSNSVTIENSVQFTIEEVERLAKIIFETTKEQIVSNQTSFGYIKLSPNSAKEVGVV
jgi:hypothetical protein